MWHFLKWPWLTYYRLDDALRTLDLCKYNNYTIHWRIGGTIKLIGSPIFNVDLDNLDRQIKLTFKNHA